MKRVLLAVLVLIVQLSDVHAQVNDSNSDGGAEPKAPQGFAAVQESPDKLKISFKGRPVAEFVFRDPKILRPYFRNVYTPSGVKVTRNHPPQAGVDAVDHDTMHPGIWLGFGDISGHDFWRNKGRIEHVRFTKAPTTSDDRIEFVTESKLLTADNKNLCGLTSHFTLLSQPSSWLLIWDATFQSNDADFAFGDQEEMGFGARLATPLIEKNGGAIVNSKGQRTAAKTWGQPAVWCDYSGTIDGKPVGITLMSGSQNFRESWWHNRDYGVFVANPFGRAAMKQGDRSSIVVKRGQPFRVLFAASVHDGTGYDPAKAYENFTK